MKDLEERTDNITNGKHTQRRGTSTTDYQSTIKRQMISKKIIETKNDTKTVQPYQQHYMSITANPMPEGKMDAQLAEEFANFLLDRIG